jgi:hypothetical protein
LQVCLPSRSKQGEALLLTHEIDTEANVATANTTSTSDGGAGLIGGKTGVVFSSVLALAGVIMLQIKASNTLFPN